MNDTNANNSSDYLADVSFSSMDVELDMTNEVLENDSYHSAAEERDELNISLPPLQVDLTSPLDSFPTRRASTPVPSRASTPVPEVHSREEMSIVQDFTGPSARSTDFNSRFQLSILWDPSSDDGSAESLIENETGSDEAERSYSLFVFGAEEACVHDNDLIGFEFTVIHSDDDDEVFSSYSLATTDDEHLREFKESYEY